MELEENLSFFHDSSQLSFFYKVCFKCSEEIFRSEKQQQYGDLAIVCGNKSYNVGFILHEVLFENIPTIDEEGNEIKYRKILSNPKEDDFTMRSMLQSRINTENEILKQCSLSLNDRQKFSNFNLITVEVQLNRKKLLVYINKQGDVSICRLVRRLYDIYKLRIKVIEVDNVNKFERIVQRYIDVSKLDAKLDEVILSLSQLTTHENNNEHDNKDNLGVIQSTYETTLFINDKNNTNSNQNQNHYNNSNNNNNSSNDINEITYLFQEQTLSQQSSQSSQSLNSYEWNKVNSQLPYNHSHLHSNYNPNNYNQQNKSYNYNYNSYNSSNISMVDDQNNYNYKNQKQSDIPSVGIAPDSSLQQQHHHQQQQQQQDHYYDYQSHNQYEYQHQTYSEIPHLSNVLSQIIQPRYTISPIPQNQQQYYHHYHHRHEQQQQQQFASNIYQYHTFKQLPQQPQPLLTPPQSQSQSYLIVSKPIENLYHYKEGEKPKTSRRPKNFQYEVNDLKKYFKNNGL